MAVVIQKDISSNHLLMAYNNNVIEFISNNTVKTVRNANIIGLGINAIIYPNPQGVFVFNFKNYVKNLINSNNFDDYIEPDVTQSFVYDTENNSYLSGQVNITVNFTDNTSEFTTKQLTFLAAAEELLTYKKGEFLLSQGFNILHPAKDRTNNTFYTFYWPGYPFEFSFYSNAQQLKIINHNNLSDFIFDVPAKINSLFISDGNLDVTIEDELPLQFGYNKLGFLIEDVLQPQNLYIIKKESRCGIYVKWLNKYGKWNYYLFEKNYFDTASIRNGQSIVSNFTNLDETTSKSRLTSKTVENTLRVKTEKLNAYEKDFFLGIASSIKIMLFTGERFAKASINDWLEIELKSNSIVMQKPNTACYEYQLEFILPQNDLIEL